jgi:hypothetical protein
MKFVFLIAAANAIKPRRLNTNNAEFIDNSLVQFATSGGSDGYDEDKWNDKLAEFNNIT